nr:rRNA 2'-O-methyltransferase fibrillarin-like [Aegilops tauschii subsp. strangulata]
MEPQGAGAGVRCRAPEHLVTAGGGRHGGRRPGRRQGVEGEAGEVGGRRQQNGGHGRPAAGVEGGGGRRGRGDAGASRSGGRSTTFAGEQLQRSSGAVGAQSGCGGPRWSWRGAGAQVTGPGAHVGRGQREVTAVGDETGRGEAMGERRDERRRGERGGGGCSLGHAGVRE